MCEKVRIGMKWEANCAVLNPGSLAAISWYGQIITFGRETGD